MKYIISDTSITVFSDNRPRTIRNTHPNWESAKTAVRNGDELLATHLMDTETAVTSWVNTGPDTDVTVKDGNVYYGNNPVHTVIATRILRMMKEGFNVRPLTNFLHNVMKNPSNRAVEELYKFLEHNNLPISEHGTFYAYKRIRYDWKDVYSGTISNTIGSVVSMERNAVNDDPTQTCSHGLHVASLPYLAHYSGSRLVLVEVNPADVVAVPIDYHNTKMRVCKYTVVSELDMATIAETDAAWKSVYSSTPNSANDEQDDEPDYYDEQDDEPDYDDEQDDEPDYEPDKNPNNPAHQILTTI